jgi:hypothetical protein
VRARTRPAVLHSPMSDLCFGDLGNRELRPPLETGRNSAGGKFDRVAGARYESRYSTRNHRAHHVPDNPVLVAKDNIDREVHLEGVYLERRIDYERLARLQRGRTNETLPPLLQRACPPSVIREHKRTFLVGDPGRHVQ